MFTIKTHACDEYAKKYKMVKFRTIKHSFNVGKQIWNIERVYVRFNIKKTKKCASGA